MLKRGLKSRGVGGFVGFLTSRFENYFDFFNFLFIKLVKRLKF